MPIRTQIACSPLRPGLTRRRYERSGSPPLSLAEHLSSARRVEGEGSQRFWNRVDDAFVLKLASRLRYIGLVVCTTTSEGFVPGDLGHVRNLTTINAGPNLLATTQMNRQRTRIAAGPV